MDNETDLKNGENINKWKEINDKDENKEKKEDKLSEINTNKNKIEDNFFINEELLKIDDNNLDFDEKLNSEPLEFFLIIFRIYMMIMIKRY